jgi:hypothetical protein
VSPRQIETRRCFEDMAEGIGPEPGRIKGRP